MYKNRVKDDGKYLANEEIQSGKIQNNIYILNFPTQFSAGFPRLQDKRAGISKNFLSFSIQFYTYSDSRHSVKLTNVRCKLDQFYEFCFTPLVSLLNMIRF